MKKLVIGTRGSALALAQTNGVAASLRSLRPDLDIDIRVIQTRGDATQAANIPLISFSEKGIFAKELETALLEQSIQIAVHSMKDLSYDLPPGLCIAAVPEREDPRDVLIGACLDDLPPGARLGTGSVRRRALFLSRRPDLCVESIRGNIDTRLRKHEEGMYDAICLAAAGINRLGLQNRVTEWLDPDWFTPDAGQGALAIQIHERDRDLWEMLQGIDHIPSHQAILAERAFVQAVGGSCGTPVGAYATVDGDELRLSVMGAPADGGVIWRGSRTFEAKNAAVSGRLMGDWAMTEARTGWATDLN